MTEKKHGGGGAYGTQNSVTQEFFMQKNEIMS
jgi:hypothetical protein